MKSYYYDNRNMSIEEKMIPTAISLLKQVSKGAELEIIESYTKDDLTNKPLQDKHVDVILHLQGRDILIDLKTTDYPDYRFLTFELLRVNVNNKIIKEGWTKLVDDFPAEDQYILFVSHTECALVQKTKFHECKANNPEDFNPDNIKWWQDKGCKKLYKKNKLLYLHKSDDLALLEEMEAKIYHGGINERWKEVSSEYYKYIN